MSYLIGTSGWQYKDWRGRFYPEDLKQTAWLGYYSERFPTVEVNNTFYRLPERSTFEKWRQETPSGFIFTIKVSRYLTHVRRLKEPQEPVERLMTRAAGLGDKLGPLLLQLPPNLQKDIPLLEGCLKAFPDEATLVVEFRHVSWFEQEVYQLLRQYGAVFCMADRGSRPITPVERTADATYMRFHEGTSIPPPCYGDDDLRSWAGRLEAIRGDGTVYIYFNNDPGGCAVADARRLAALLHAPMPA